MARTTEPRWWREFSPVATVAALVCALGYVVLVLHYAVDAPQADEWGSVLPLVLVAAHHHLSVRDLWVQHYNEGRLVLANVAFVVVGRWDHFNVRTLIGLSAVVHCVAFGALLVLFRRYSGRRVGLVPVVTLAIVWFALSNTNNALWGYQIQLYLTLLCLLLTLLALDLATRRTGLAATLAWIGAFVGALATSYSTVQGLLVWVVGALVIAWTMGAAARWCALGGWVAAAAVTGITYRAGYVSQLGYSGCLGTRRSTCATSYALHHATQLPGYFVALLGNAAPSDETGALLHTIRDVGLHQVLGCVLLAVALVVVVDALRHRAARANGWISPALILFGMGWDALIAVGRVSGGPRLALQSHFGTPQLLVVAGIAFWLLRALTDREPGGARDAGATRAAWTLRSVAAGSMLAVIVVSIVALSATLGLRDARFYADIQRDEARLLANYDRLPPATKPCDVSVLVDLGFVSGTTAELTLRPQIEALEIDHLATFAPRVYAHYRALGPPDVPICDRRAVLREAVRGTVSVARRPWCTEAQCDTRSLGRWDGTAVCTCPSQ
ncbi:MAG TPA: hypothetical protein VGO03_21035 [Acidimicrobiia bacterium]